MSYVLRRPGFKSPVDVRADLVHGEYVSHCEYADRTYANVSPRTTTGPFRNRLPDYGQVFGLVSATTGRPVSRSSALQGDSVNKKHPTGEPVPSFLKP